MEQIYTIPVNEAFDDSRDNPSVGCPICSLFRRLEENELQLILGASMMEPDIRVKTNRLGFCGEHYASMQRRKNRLGMALMLESHLDEARDRIFPHGLTALLSKSGDVSALAELEGSCYVCQRVDFHLTNMISTVILLWENDEAFREKFAAQGHFCLPHYRRLLDYADRRMSKKDRAAFRRVAESIELAYYDRLREDIKEFCRSFDYRFEGDASPESKTAVDRAVRFLSGKEGREVKPC